MSEVQVDLQVPTSSTKFNTDGRTDGLTKKLVTDVETLSVVTTREVDEITVGDVIASGELWATTERHERRRIGERAKIARHVRAAVWYRDQGKCAQCHPEYPSGDVLHLDHITPWSAGGPDTTDNLRLLCERHNLKRSNFIDHERPKRPATWWCSNCYVLDEHVWEYSGDWSVKCPRHGLGADPAKVRCRVGRAYGKAWLQGDPTPTWHQDRPLLTAFDRVAYCAHCNAPGMTDVPL